MHSFKFTMFLHNKSCSKEMSQLIIMIPPWFQECIYWMKSVIWRHLMEAFIFSAGALETIHMSRTLLSILQLLLQPSILLQAVCGWFEKNWMICLFEESYCSPALLLRCLFIPQNYLQWYLFEKCCAKCTKELVATPLFVGECVNLQFHNSNCSYSLSEVNFYKSNCRHLYLQGWLPEQRLSPKNCSFRVLIALIYFYQTVVFGNSYF